MDKTLEICGSFVCVEQIGQVLVCEWVYRVYEEEKNFEGSLATLERMSPTHRNNITLSPSRHTHGVLWA